MVKVDTMQAPCGCVFEAEGEMRMISYCRGCEAALNGLARVHCPECGADFGCGEERDEHVVTEHLGIELRPLRFVMPAVAAIG